MENVFFYCHNLIMDVVKLFDKLFEDEELRGIPLEYVFRVAYEVIILIASGECFLMVD